MRNSAPISRRTIIKGAGVSLALPWMEAMQAASIPVAKRFCAIQFPFGVAMPTDQAPDRCWGWFPLGKGGEDFVLTKPLAPLESVIDRASIFSGLSHPLCRSLDGHDSGDSFLTATPLKQGTFKNSISLDQLIADRIGHQSRFRSMTLSTDGGVGPKTRTTTLSYDAEGQAIPALSEPKVIFEQMFGRKADSGSVLDAVGEQTKTLQKNLGRNDRLKLEEFQASVREVEQRVADAHKGPEAYLTAMYDLMFLALQTDATRVITYQIGSMGPSRARAFPLAMGFKQGWHELAHFASAEAQGRFDQFLTAQLARFLGRLRETQEGAGSLLDHTQILYGSTNSETHVNRNYPLVLAGGSHEHGQFHRLSESIPLSNLFVSILNEMGITDRQFADSTGRLKV